MWKWRSEHVVAFAISAGVIACPRPLWDRLRLPLAGAAALEASQPGPSREKELETDLALVRAELSRKEAALAELERIVRQTTALKEAEASVEPLATLPVRVLGADGASRAGARAGRVRLDAGSRRGVGYHAALAQGAALAGRVVAVAEDWAEAELVTAPLFRARCRDVRSGVEGIVGGAGTGPVWFRPDGAAPDVLPGDELCTSASSRYAPGGLAVGRVVALERDPQTGLVLARLEPAAALEGLERALVLLEPSPPAGAGAGGAPVAHRNGEGR